MRSERDRVPASAISPASALGSAPATGTRAGGPPLAGACGTDPRLGGAGDAKGFRARRFRMPQRQGCRRGRVVAYQHGGRDWLLRRLLAISDCVALVLSLAVVTATAADGNRGTQVLFALLTVPAWIALFAAYGLYERDVKRLSHSTLDDVPSLFHSLLLGCLLMWCFFAAVAPSKLPFPAILLFASCAIATVLAGRTFTRAAFMRVAPPERVLLIGSGELGSALIGKLRASARLRLRPVGVLSCGPRSTASSSSGHLGRLEDVDLARLMVERGVARLIVSDADLKGDVLLGVLRDCKATGVKVSLLPSASGALGPSVEVDDVQGVTVLGINPSVLSRSSRAAKRGLDLLVTALLSLVALPLVALLAVAVKLDSPGPAFFIQERVGRGGRRFRLIKLRTMSRDAERRRDELVALSRDPGWLHLERDPRVTRIGRLLRLTSLDELPQLWNVLRGDMSLVGPRPLVVEEDSRVDDWARGRLDLTPGITGLWQVLGRTSIPFEEMVKLDYLYVTNWSLWGDLRLMLRTLPAVLRRRGAN